MIPANMTLEVSELFTREMTRVSICLILYWSPMFYNNNIKKDYKYWEEVDGVREGIWVKFQFPVPQRQCAVFCMTFRKSCLTMVLPICVQ